MPQNLYQKVWNEHKVTTLPDGREQIFIGTHLIHEVTSPQAFGMLEDLNLEVAFPHRTFATVDHIIPTKDQTTPFRDNLANDMFVELEKNTTKHGITYFNLSTGKQGIVHMVGPEQGITQPGTTIVCGDSHTATHGAFGAIAFGIGTTQVRDVLATQTLAMDPLKVRKIEVNGTLYSDVTAKDVILYIIKLLGAKGGLGYAYEYSGEVFRNMSMEERMTVCNMSIEGGARCGYVCPDQTTYDYLKNRPYSPKGIEWDKSLTRWQSFVSDDNCSYDDVVVIDAKDILPRVTWGISPDQSCAINETIPTLEDCTTAEQKATLQEALSYMQFKGGEPITGIAIDVAFIGSCTNGRISDFRAAAEFLKGKKISPTIQTAIAVPGSQITALLCKQEGIDTVFKDAGFEWRKAGCSMCLAMNPDKLIGNQICASSSNRNYKGRQGSATGRTLLMSPLMVASSAVKGYVNHPLKN